MGKKICGWVRKAEELVEKGEVDYWLRVRKRRLEKEKSTILDFTTPLGVEKEEAQGTKFPKLAPTG